MDQESYAIFQVILLVVRIIITFYCINKAGELNRSKAGWGIFGFIFPIVALIWIQFMKPKIIWDKIVTTENQQNAQETK
jgi:hypothetical protein